MHMFHLPATLTNSIIFFKILQCLPLIIIQTEHRTMHRNSSKSLRHVGKLGEGYLSDVHTSFSNLHYDSDASSDLMESSKVLEKQFKDKYKILRMAYERRIQQLTTTVESVCAKLLGDDLIASMKTDVASSFFIPAHISETLASFLQGERESDVQDLLERESALSIQLSRKNSIIDNQNSRIAELEEVGAKGKASEVELNSLQEKLVALEAQYSAYSLQSKEEVVESKRRREAEALKNQSLQDQLDKCQAELSVLKNYVHSSHMTHTQIYLNYALYVTL